MVEQHRKNAYLYAKFRDQQFSLFDNYAKEHGMLMKTFLVANALFYAENGLLQKEICEKTFQSKQAVNLIIKNMLKDGHVTLSEVASNKRIKLVQMTEAGRKHFEKDIRHITWAEDTAMSMLSEAEQEQLINLSRTFTQHLIKLVKGED